MLIGADIAPDVRAPTKNIKHIILYTEDETEE